MGEVDGCSHADTVDVTPFGSLFRVVLCVLCSRRWRYSRFLRRLRVYRNAGHWRAVCPCCGFYLGFGSWDAAMAWAWAHIVRYHRK